MSDLYKFLDELRSKISIVDVVGEKVKLTRKGKEHTGLCPFHNEKTPSFTVNEAKGFYHCFGCGAHGDIVKFEMENNNLPFMEAVQKLANKAGLQVPALSRENQAETEKKATQYDILEMACKFFEKNLRLTGGRQALDYLYNRGFNDETIEKFRLGYAPNNNGLKAQLASKNVSEHDMIELGLTSLSENSSGRMFDFFRDRVIIPIFDKKGRCIAFGGRIMGQGQPKYLNSPETPVFNKRRILYNLHNARDKAYEAKSLIICEGYMDVIALDKYGFSNAMAPLGTALTEDQITEAWKICPEPTLCFDGDAAGIKAATRSVDRALPILKAGHSLKFAFLPDNMDPDEYLKAKGKDEFEKIIRDTKPLVELLWKKNLDGQITNTPEQKALIEKNLFEDIAKITDSQVRTYYQQEIKSRIYNEFGTGGKTPFNKTGKLFARTIRPHINLDDLALKYIIAAMISHPEIIAQYEEKFLMLDIKNQDLKSLFDDLIEASQSIDRIDFDKLKTYLENNQLLKKTDSLRDDIGSLLKIPSHLIGGQIDVKILELQLKQIEADIRECVISLEKADSPDENLFEKYETLKKERDSLLNTVNF